MQYKRKLKKKTDYKKRLKYLLSGKPRLVIRRSNKFIYAQIVEYKPEGDVTLISVTSKELIKIGYKGRTKNTPSAYLTGLLLAKKAKQKSINTAVPDIGFHSHIKGSLIFALIKGVFDGGLNLKMDKSILPSESRMKGEHIANMAKKQNMSNDMQNIAENIEQIKNKLIVK